MPVQKVARRRRLIPLRELPELVKRYVDAKVAEANFGDQRTRARSTLIEAFEHDGEEDEKGNLYLDLPEHVQDSKGRLTNRIKLQKNVSEKLKPDEDVEKLLADLGLLEQCQETIVVLSEEKILHLHAAGDISEKQLAEMYTEKVVWSLPTL